MGDFYPNVWIIGGKAVEKNVGNGQERSNHAEIIMWIKMVTYPQWWISDRLFCG